MFNRVVPIEGRVIWVAKLVHGLHLEALLGLRFPFHQRSPYLHDPPSRDDVLQHPILLLWCWNYITELFFWTLLVGMFCFARFVKKRDYVSSALPVAAVLAAVGEPWVRIVVMGSYLALAVFHHTPGSREM